MTKKLKPGDVLRIDTPSGFIYLHYLGRHEMYGDAVKIAPGVHSKEDGYSAALFENGYVTFYPAKVAVNKGMATIAANAPAEGLPKRMRRAGARVGTSIKTWIIEEEGLPDIVRKELSMEERMLPIVAVRNHEMLLLRVAQGWRPETEGDFRGIGDEERPPVSANAPALVPSGVVSHYLYFPKNKVAERAAVDLRAGSFDASVRREADGPNWLVMARHVPLDQVDLEKARTMMEKLASDGGGEYDGSETEVVGS